MELVRLGLKVRRVTRELQVKLDSQEVQANQVLRVLPGLKGSWGRQATRAILVLKDRWEQLVLLEHRDNPVKLDLQETQEYLVPEDQMEALEELE